MSEMSNQEFMRAMRVGMTYSTDYKSKSTMNIEFVHPSSIFIYACWMYKLEVHARVK
jgi:hypothetical protein